MAKATPVKGVGPKRRGRKAARLLLEARLNDARRFERAAQKADYHGVHDLRVSCRRLRAALKHLSADARLDRLERRVKALQDVLGELRDVQQLQKWLSTVEEPTAGEARWRERLEGQRQKHSAAVARTVERWRREDAPRLEARIRKAALHPLGKARTRKKLARRIEQLHQHSSVPLDHEKRVHEARILAKKLKYQAELLGEVSPREVGALVERLEPVQDALGALHDLDERIRRLSEEAKLEDAGARFKSERGRLTKAAKKALEPWERRAVARALSKGFTAQ